MIKNYRIKLMQDTRRVKKGNKYPVKFEIYFFNTRVRWYVTLKNLDLTIDDYNRILLGKRLKQKDLEVQEYIDYAKNKIDNILQNHKVRDNKKLRKLFLDIEIHENNENNINDIWELFKYKIKKLERENRPKKTIALYNTTQNHLQNFYPDILLEEITHAHVAEFIKKLADKNLSVASVGCYFRHYRAVYNLGRELGVINTQTNPFLKHSMPIRIKRHKALTQQELLEIFNAYPVGDKQQFAVDFFLLSYLLNGLDFKDICNMRFSNISDDKLIIERIKSINNVNVRKEIIISIVPQAKQIIDKYCNKTNDVNSYVFPFWRDEMSETTRANRTNSLLKRINKYINELINQNNISINFKVTYNMARHTFATLAMHSGIKHEMISEAMGHRNLKTTQDYLHGLSHEQHEAFNQMKMSSLLKSDN